MSIDVHGDHTPERTPDQHVPRFKVMPRDTEYWENRNLMMFKPDAGYDFTASAEQTVVRGYKQPLWEPTFGSRAPLPAYERQELFGCLSYDNMRNMRLVTPRIRYPAGVLQPSGMVSLRSVTRRSPVTIPDSILYDSDVQKVFGIFAQFDALFTEQVAAFTGLSMERAFECARILYAFGVLDRSSPDWPLTTTFGELWRFNRRGSKPRDYANGMDTVPRLLMEGNRNIGVEPPGGGARSGLKHNVYAAEMCLRLAESADNVIGIWGDSFLNEKDFHDTDPDAYMKRHSQGDCAVVTKDGSVVMFEVVGRKMKDILIDYSILEKAASWVGVIANSPIDLYVIFVDVTFAHSYKTTIRSVDLGIRRESKKYAPNEYSREMAARHVGVVGGNYWFPEDHAISRGGTRLVAYNTMMRKFHCYDIPDRVFSSPDIRRDIVVNSASALHTPPWICDPIKERDYGVH